MPELPEVETVVRGLRKKIVGATIVGVWLDWPKMIKDADNPRHNYLSKRAVANFKRSIVGKRVVGMRRRGKNVLFDFAGGWTMLVHQKMTGHFLVGRWRVVGKRVEAISPRQMITDKWNGYIRMLFYLDDGRMLAFSDLRRFGKVILAKTKTIESLVDVTGLGPDALGRELTVKKLEEILSRQGRAIKTVLMDPAVIAGVGNIYSDEVLWRIGVDPERRASSLSAKEYKSLHKELRVILTEAVRMHGTTVGDFRDPDGRPGRYGKSRQVYGRKGQGCLRCRGVIERKKIGGRSASFCSGCQK